MTLERNSPLPLNYQLAKKLEQDIISGLFAEGDKLPSLRKLATEYKISLPMVRQSLQLLQNQGLIDTIQGKGSFVLEIPQDIDQAESKKSILFITNRNERQATRFFMKILFKFEEVAASKNLRVEFSQTSENEDCSRMFSSRIHEGVVFFGTPSDKVFDTIKRLDIPMVIVGDYNDNKDIVNIINNDFDGGCQVADYFLSKKHKEIGIFASDKSKLYAKQRIKGFKSILKKQGLSPAFIEDCKKSDPQKVARQLLQNQDITAIFALSDDLAYSLYSAAEELNIDIPNQVSVIGFDDENFSQFLSPSLTTVRISPQDVSEECIKQLNILRSKEYTSKTVEIDVQIIERKSVIEQN